ncbi:MAG: phenylacetic acid degradation protein PaaN, partial [Phycisphaerae bacterium]
IRVGGERMAFDDVARVIIKSVDGLLGDPARAAEVLGCIQNEATDERIDQAADEGGQVLRQSERLKHPAFPEARVRSPIILKTDGGRRELYMRERFGPIVYLVATEATEQSIRLALEAAREHGAITCGIYSTDPAVLETAMTATAEAGVPLSCNLTGQVFVNQSAAFSDFHVSGANPAGNATLCDGAFVANRFRVVHNRVPVAESGT